MPIIDRLVLFYHRLLDLIKPADGIAPLALRLLLAPVMLEAGFKKFAGFSGSVAFFDNQGIPFPELMVALTALAEFGGGMLLLAGLATRAIALPLMVVMLVAAFVVHGQNGWLVLSDGNSWLANERVMEAQEQKRAIRELMREHGDYRWLTMHGPMTILNNGMQFAITYFIMLLALFFTGGGRFTSLDYWLAEWLKKRETKPVENAE